MASGGSDQNAKCALSKLLQMGTMAEYEKAFSFARIAEAHFEDERSVIAIVKPNELTANVHIQDLEQTTRKRGDEPNRILLVTIHHMIYPITVKVLNQIFSPHGYVKKVVIFHKSAHVQALIQFQSRQNAIVARNSLQGCNIYEGCRQLDIQFSNLEELQENLEEHICYYWENCFSILNAEEAGNTKSSLSADTFGNRGVDESETSVPETPAKEVVDNGNGSALIFLVGYDTGSKTSSEKWVDSGSERRDYTLFGASLFAFLNLGSVYFARKRIWDLELISLQDNTLRARKVIKAHNRPMTHLAIINTRCILSLPSITLINKSLSFSLFSYGVRTRYSGANLSLLVLYILKDAKKSSSEGVDSSSRASHGNQVTSLLRRLKKARNDPSLPSEYERYVHSDFVTHLQTTEFETFDVLGFWKEKETMFPILSRMAMDILSVQATSVASESAFSTSGRVLSILRTRLTPASLEMCMCLKDHLDAQERKQDKSTLETPVDFEEDILDAGMQANEAIPLSDKKIALDVASSEGSLSGPGSGGEEAEANYGYNVYHDDY
nr:polypyrimidine tract-binding protein homolog 3-like isoform X1 [Tanacetum cinerariifolium]